MTKKSIKGTKTEKNLVIAYMAESGAYSRYTYYAGQADKEEYFPIGEIFRETAANELRHGKIFFKYLEGGSLDVCLGVDAGESGDELYTQSAKVADEEGFPEIAEHFRAIASIEKRHHERFMAYLKQVKEGTVWKRTKPITWQCLVCGYQMVGKEPPKVCPACDHPYQHYIALDMDEL